MVVFLSKPTESDGFEQIVDFPKAHPIRYAFVNPTIYISCIKQFWSTAMAKTINGEVQLHAKVDGKKIIVTESSVRTDIRLADKEDKAVHKELGDSLVRDTTTASSLEAEQDSDNLTKTQSKATPNESSSQGTNSGGGPRGNTLRSDENRMKFDELIALCTNLQNIVLDFEKTKTTQRNEIVSLKMRVKKFEKRNRSRTHGLKRLYKVGLTARVESSDDEESLEMFDVTVLDGEEVFVAGQNENFVEEVIDATQVSTTATTVTITTKEITLAQALKVLKTLKPKVKWIVFQEPGKSITTIISSQQSQDKGKGIMIEEPVKPKKKDQIRLDEEASLRLQAEFNEKERLA
nr:hypothetical protein [Tanacetum cinerariifolium]